MASNLNYFLIEANRVKLGGYVAVRPEFMNGLLNLLYPKDSSGYTYIKARLNRYEFMDYGAQTNGKNDILISCFTENVCHVQRYLVTSNTSKIVRSIYIQAQTNEAFKELAFVLFLTGMVNSLDYLSIFRDVGSIMGRFAVNQQKFAKSNDVIKPIFLSPQNYLNLLLMYVQNIFSGVEYSLNIYDFIYHALKVSGLKYTKRGGSNYKRYMMIVDSIVSLPISESLRFDLNPALIEKYAEEISILVSAFASRFKASDIDVLMNRLLNVDKYDSVYIELLLKSSEFIWFMERSCFKYQLSV